MADVAEVQFLDVSSYTHGTDVYKGIEKVSLRVRNGSLVGTRKEGELNFSGKNRQGADEFPVEIEVESRSSSTLVALLAAADGTVVFTAKEAGTANSKLVTITSVEYESSQGTAQRDKHGTFSITGKSVGTVTITDPV